VRSEGRALHELAADLERWPQVTRNVKAPRRGEWSTIPAFADAVREAETQLASSGRIVVRPSGTEPVLRIMVEARDATVATSTAQRLEDIAMRELAAPREAGV
jgi:phosphoglucosamine mutase